ncbi:MAG: serpin family protein, partial [Burkholderiaceae bacterium]|nr:serpin family protein [Burkholderiaceae bacterium]
MKKAQLVILTALLLLLQACGSRGGHSGQTGASTNPPHTNTTQSATLAASSLPRNASLRVPAADAAALLAGNTAFATDLYGTLRNESAFTNRNLFFSPYSISAALAMTYAGAGGATASQLQNTMHFTLPDNRLNAAFDALDLALTSSRPTAPGQVPLTLRIANSMWGEQQMTFQQPFLDPLAIDYGAGVHLADFINAPDTARITINNWVAGETRNKILNLLTPESITSATRFVLVNAVYFNGGWSRPFVPQVTVAGTFHAVTGDQTAQMMTETLNTAYGSGNGWQAVTLPYDGGLTFTAILPKDLATFESSFNAATLASINSSLALAQVNLTMPKFTIPGTSFSVRDALQTLRATAVFDRVNADLTGIANLRPQNNLYVNDVLHQAYISVDEKG